LQITNPKTSPSRAAAFDILLRVEQGAFADELLHSGRLDELSAADRALCTEIVMGVLRWRSRLDLAIGLVSSQPVTKLDVEVLTALRISAYQIGFLERVPKRAAVNESVELVKRARKRSAATFVNAVLRKLADKPSLVIPLLASGAKTVLDFSENYAHPLWLVERWAAAYGLETAERICDHDQRVPSVAVRIKNAHVESELIAAGIQLAPGALLSSARTVIAGDVTKTAAFQEGGVAIQDEGSQLVALLVGRGERLLDCCAAPGGKTRVLAEQNPNAMLVATEIHPRRAQTAHRLVRAPNVQVIVADAAALPFARNFDRVLADVPCSGTGTLARNPEIKWRLKPDDLVDLRARQVAILNGALQHLAPGGRLVYSSCSLEREENEAVIDEALAGCDDVRVTDIRPELERLRDSGELAWSDIGSLTRGPYLRTLPGVHPWDGFFAAILSKSAADEYRSKEL
jgi:16S rRNA (cytosine967-C5)-methyltransferase